LSCGGGLAGEAEVVEHVVESVREAGIKFDGHTSSLPVCQEVYLGRVVSAPRPLDGDTITVNVEGIPAPQGSKIRTRYGMRESSKRVAPWRAAVEAAVDRLALFEALEPPYRIETWFYFQRPRTTRAKHPVAPTVGDGDKLTRSTWDALTKAGLIEDDRFVTEWGGSKEWAGPTDTPGAIIRVTSLKENS